MKGERILYTCIIYTRIFFISIFTGIANYFINIKHDKSTDALGFCIEQTMLPPVFLALGLPFCKATTGSNIRNSDLLAGASLV